MLEIGKVKKSGFQVGDGRVDFNHVNHVYTWGSLMNERTLTLYSNIDYY